MDRTPEEGSEEAGPYQEAVRYEVMAPLERWLLYFFAAAAVLLFIYEVERHRSVRRKLGPANGHAKLPSASSWDGSANNKAFVLRQD